MTDESEKKTSNLKCCLGIFIIVIIIAIGLMVFQDNPNQQETITLEGKTITIPQGWTKDPNSSEGFFNGPEEGMKLVIEKKTDNSWFENNTNGYSFSQTKTGSYVYFDEGMHTFGSFEVVKINGVEYMVDMSDKSTNYDKHLDRIAEDFEMFNQLNNLTPEKQ